MPELEVSVGPVYLFGLASRQAQWLAVRQATIAGNISNANTPGYKALDVEPFTSVLDKTRLAIATTDPRHISLEDPAARTAEIHPARSWDVAGQSNDVSLEN